MIDKVEDHLYLGSAHDVLHSAGKAKLKSLKITHVLTISAMPVAESDQLPDVVYMFAFAMDTPRQDLLGCSLLEDCLRFIADAISEDGNVFVHCEAGVSRSVTVVGAYLMRKHEWSSELAVTKLTQIRPNARPNNGFMKQLSFFEETGFRADSESLRSCRSYCQWCAETGNSGHLVEYERGKPADPVAETFKCYKCRNVLFHDRHLIRHWKRNGEQCQFGYLITPMKWISMSEYQGKISCPHCGEKLGQFSWGGRKCQDENDCGTPITPWVHLHRAKIDKASVPNSSAIAPPMSPSIAAHSPSLFPPPYDTSSHSRLHESSSH